MKKMLVALFAVASLVGATYANETKAEGEYQRVETRTVTPVVFSVHGKQTIDIIGMRLGVWGACHNVTGLDLMLGGGEAVNAYGLQVSLLRNKVIDRAGALQVAIGYNSAGTLSGAQVSLYNQAIVAKGVQVGLINAANDVRGLQIGLVNTTDAIYGYQIGIINVIKSSPTPFFPIINFTPSAD